MNGYLFYTSYETYVGNKRFFSNIRITVSYPKYIKLCQKCNKFYFCMKNVYLHSLEIMKENSKLTEP